MTGPEHYRRAQELLDRAEGWPDFDRYPMTTQERSSRQAADATAAHAHAMLALAAAQLQIGYRDGALPPEQVAAWQAVGVVMS